MPNPKDHPKMRAAMWKKGQSGNPKGRPKRPTFEALVATILDEHIPGSDVTKREALARVFVDAMLKRNAPMIREFLERSWPKTTRLEVESVQPRSPEYVPTEEEQKKIAAIAESGGHLH